MFSKEVVDRENQPKVEEVKPKTIIEETTRGEDKDAKLIHQVFVM